MHLLFQNYFLDYINKQSEVSLDQSADRLASFYESTGSWQPLRRNHRLWFRLSSGQNSPREQRSGKHPRPPPEGDRFLRQALLIGSDDQAVIGHRGVLKRDDVFRKAIAVDGQVVGYLLAPKRTRITAAIDRNFADSLNRSMIVVLGFGVILSLIVAALLARNISRPVVRLSNAAGELSAGHYETRVNLKRSDELGRLAKDFDKLAAVLEANRRTQQRWVADISHELRTPLAIIRGELQALEDGVREFNDRSLNSLVVEVERFSRLVNDLYDLSRAEAGDLNYRMESLNLIDVLQHSVDSFGPRFREKGLHLSCSADDQALRVMGDPARLSQLISNLLENSLRYTDTPGCTEIHCAGTSSGLISIAIEDTAPGVPNDALERIFDRLYRVEDSRNSIHGGGGLGLAICKAIVEAHQGNIQAVQTERGGLKIEVLLPIEGDS